MINEQQPWPHPCRSCGGNGGHESGCPGDSASAAAGVDASPPAPSGWQQQIFALRKDVPSRELTTEEEAEHRGWTDALNAVCELFAGQHAKDAPPVVEADADLREEEIDDLRDGAEQLESDYIALKKTCEEMARELNRLRPQAGQNAKDALPPAPPAGQWQDSTLLYSQPACGSCGHIQALHADRGGGSCNDRGCECSGFIALPPAPEGSPVEPSGASKTLVVRTYYASGQPTYRSCFHTHADKRLGHYEEIERLVEAANVQDGDEVVIEIRKTGGRPFGNRRYILQAPHTYAPETDEQMRERHPEPDASPAKETPHG